MRASQFLGLVALPLAAAMPTATLHHARGAGADLSHRTILMEDSQFNFQPFILTNIGMQCARPSAAAMYGCELRCKLQWPPPPSSLVLDTNEPSAKSRLG